VHVWLTTRKPLAESVPGVYAAASWLVIVTVTGSDVAPAPTAPKSWLAVETSRFRPVPLSAPDTSVGPLVTTSSVALRAPVADGSNATRTRQLAPVASGAAPLHVSSVIANWSGSAPVSATLPTAIGSEPVLVSVSARAAEGPASICRLLKFAAVVGVSVAVTSADADAGATSSRTQRSSPRRTPRGGMSKCIRPLGERVAGSSVTLIRAP
jgi:hypothetical protein